MNGRKSFTTSVSYIEHSVPAHTVSRGDHIATYNGRRTHPVFRRVERAGEYADGTVWIIASGSVVPQTMGRDTPVMLRERRRIR